MARSTPGNCRHHRAGYYSAYCDSALPNAALLLPLRYRLALLNNEMNCVNR